MSKVWLVIEEDLFDRSEAQDPIATVTVFAEEEKAQDYALAAATKKGYTYDEENDTWWDEEETAGTVRCCASLINT